MSTTPHSGSIRLDTYEKGSFTRGRPALMEALWIAASALFFSSSIPSPALRKALLRLFGARIGVGVVIKQQVKVKFPWRLEIGDHTWIGERVWIDNLAPVRIGAHSCISQDAYLCTGNHDWKSSRFDLQTKPILIADQAWICARAVVGPGVSVGEGAIVSLGAVASSNVPAWHVLTAAEPTLRARARPQSTGG